MTEHDKSIVGVRADASVISDEAMWRLIADGDLSKLSDRQKSNYYLHLCESQGLNPATQPFRYMVLNNKLTLYAQKGATDQLRRINGVDIVALEKGIEDDLFVVTVRVRDKTGRTDEDMGAVPISGLKGEAKVNAMLKAVTKAKRRATLSICGLGFLDETEVDSIPSARVMPMREGSVVPAVDVTPARPNEGPGRAEPAQMPPDTINRPADEPGPPSDVQEAEWSEPAPAKEEMITDRQMKFLWAIAKEKFADQADELLHALAGLRGLKSLKDLTRDQASKMGDYLKAESPGNIAKLAGVELRPQPAPQQGAMEIEGAPTDTAY